MPRFPTYPVSLLYDGEASTPIAAFQLLGHRAEELFPPGGVGPVKDPG
jgi:hypothetical protein